MYWPEVIPYELLVQAASQRELATVDALDKKVMKSIKKHN